MIGVAFVLMLVAVPAAMMVGALLQTAADWWRHRPPRYRGIL